MNVNQDFWYDFFAFALNQKIIKKMFANNELDLKKIYETLFDIFFWYFVRILEKHEMIYKLINLLLTHSNSISFKCMKVLFIKNEICGNDDDFIFIFQSFNVSENWNANHLKCVTNTNCCNIEYFFTIIDKRITNNQSIFNVEIWKTISCQNKYNFCHKNQLHKLKLTISIQYDWLIFACFVTHIQQ